MPRTAYIHSDDYANIVSRLPSNIDRSKKVHALIEAYGLLRLRDLTTISPRKATIKELCRYHSRDYIEFLNKAEDYDSGEGTEDNSDNEEDTTVTTRGHGKEDKLEEYGLRFDCSVFEGIADYTAYVAGSTLEAATLLCDDAFDIVIHWDGGRHHAKKDAAAGFCIVNDIVLGIMELQKSFDRVLYLDLDVHHGDGVESAFQFTDKVLTVSIHHHAEGFYPGTGSGIPSSARTKAVINIPMQAGLSDETLSRVFDEMIDPLFKQFGPDAVVLQCGVDGRDISDEIPEHKYFEDYQPDFLLFIDPGRQLDSNTEEHLAHVRSLVDNQSKTLSSQR
ncbi:Histone deacetylase 8 [Linnemannia exigua]|uniref:histone deacetylase n=1 Tax=Linnemannia exigua TaxID=604196 RepID=A0AAD4DD38_9FUNG|nr:Histone deacetylase 8 [Linnemannia exigua]